MSLEVKLFILPSVVKDRMGLHTNVDDKLVVPEIKAAQDMYIRPLLGSILFDKMLTDVNTLSGKYKDLFEQFIIDALCNYVMAELPEALNYQYWNKGVATKNTQESSTPSLTDMYTIVGKYRKRAEHYANAARLFILANVTQLPEYHAAGGVDKVSPDASTFTSPIYLGPPSADWGRPNYDPNKNSNDPYYPV
jgi:hypothetical protein